MSAEIQLLQLCLVCDATYSGLICAASGLIMGSINSKTCLSPVIGDDSNV